MKPVTVLITASGNVFMPGTTACLRNNGERTVRLIGADMSDDPTMLEMVDIYYPVPRGDAPEYPDALLEICKKEHVDVLLPIMSSELNALSANKERFEAAGTKVSVSPLEGLTVANNKLSLFEHMKASGILCADFRRVHSARELAEAVVAFGYPNKKVCVKTPDSSGSRGFRILDAKQQSLDTFLHDKPNSSAITLESFLNIFDGVEAFPEMMVMEYLPGEEYTIDLLADHGRVLYNCCRKSLGMTNSIMLDGIVVKNAAAEKLCEQVVNSLQLDGNIGFDLKERADGTPLIMECNPRITAGIPFFAAAGVNLPYLCVKKLLGEPLPDVSPVIGKKMKRRYTEMYY